MPSDRYFINAPLVQGSHVTIEGNEHHHLVHVMRAKAGESVELVNGKGFLAQGLLQALSKREAQFLIESVVYEEPPTFSLVLAQAVPRMNRLDLIVEKGTELGMSSLWLFPAERGERQKLTEHQFDRLRNLAISAMKQCGRLYLPEIVIKSTLTECTSAFQEGVLLFGDLSPNAPSLIKFWPDIAQKSEIIFFVGPESGFSDAEEIALKKRGAHGVALHKNILRTETAALTALALLQHLHTYSLG